MINIEYLMTHILTEDKIICNLKDVYNALTEWSKSISPDLTPRKVYEFYLSGKIHNDKTIFFYNFIKTMQYCELNQIYYE